MVDLHDNAADPMLSHDDEAAHQTVHQTIHQTIHQPISQTNNTVIHHGEISPLSAEACNNNFIAQSTQNHKSPIAKQLRSPNITEQYTAPDTYEQELYKCQHDLKTNHIVALELEDYEIGVSIAHNLFEELYGQDSKSFKEYIKDIDTANKTTEPHTSDNIISFNFGHLINSIDQINDHCCIVINLITHDISPMSFFGEYVSTDNQELNRSNNISALRSKNIRIIVLINKDSDNRKKLSNHFYICSLNALEILINYFCPNKILDYKTRLVKQVEAGYWGKEFIKNIRKKLRDGIGALDTQCNDIEHSIKTKIRESRAITNSLKDPLKGPLYHLILFLLNHFNNLTRSQFDALIQIFLQNEPISPEPTDKKNNSPVPSSQPSSIYFKSQDIEFKIDKGDVNVSHEDNIKEPRYSNQATEPLSLLTLWNKRYRLEILKSLNVHPILDEEKNVLYIGIQNTAKNAIYYEALKRHDPFYIDAYINKILQYNLVFIDDRSMAGQAKKLLITAITHDPSRFDASWLIQWLEQSINQNNSRDSSSNKHSISALYQKTTQTPDNKHILSQWSQLLKALQDIDQSRDLVQSTLITLMNETAFDLVLYLVRQLDYHSEFDSFYWLKQLIARGNDQVYKETIDYVIKYYSQRMNGQTLSIDHFIDWLPDQEKNSHLTRLENTALWIPMILLTCPILDYQHIDKKLIPHHIFPITRPLEDSITLSDQYSDFIKILCHPGQMADNVAIDDHFRGKLCRDAGKALLGIILLKPCGGWLKKQIFTQDQLKNPQLHNSILKIPMAQERPFDCLLTLIYMVWGKRLITDQTGDHSKEQGLTAIRTITQCLIEELSQDRVLFIRDYLRAIRAKLTELKNHVEQPSPKTLSTIAKITHLSRTLNNIVYDAKKQRSLV